LALGRITDSGAPLWLGAVLPGLATLALIPPATRLPVLICWIVAAAGAVVAAVFGQLTFSLPTVTVRPAVGVIGVFLPGVAIIAVAVAVQGLIRTQGSAIRRAAGVAFAAIVVVVPVVGLVWTATTASDAVRAPQAAEIPAYMTQSASVSPERGVLVVRGDVAEGLSYVVRREDGTTVGEDEITALSPVDDELTATVRGVVSVPTPELVAVLARKGIEYVVLAAPADDVVAARLDAVGGITPVSSESRSTRAWQIEAAPPRDAIAGKGPGYRTWLLVLQALAVVFAMVMCGPGRRDRAQVAPRG
jgi:hypothetical protein